MSNFLNVCIYRKPYKKAALVFRKKDILYRITTIEHSDKFIKALNIYADSLKNNSANPEYIQEIHCPRKRHRVLEIGLEEDEAVLNVFERLDTKMKRCFKWSGNKNELTNALKNFWVMAFFMRG